MNNLDMRTNFEPDDPLLKKAKTPRCLTRYGRSTDIAPLSSSRRRLEHPHDPS